MRKKELRKNIIGAFSLSIFILIVAVIIAYLPSANLSDGIWQGNFDINGKGEHDFTALYIDGKVVAVSRSANVVYQGTVSADNKQYQSAMDMYILNKGMFDSVQLTGDLNEPGSIQASYATGNGQNQGNLSLEYQANLFEQPATLEKLNGDWILYNVINILKIKITDGVLSGADNSGCAYAGKIDAINPQYNAYDVSMVISSCDDLNMELTGMAYLSSDLESNDTFNIHVFGEQWSQYMPIVRNDDTHLIDKHKTWGGPPGPGI